MCCINKRKSAMAIFLFALSRLIALPKYNFDADSTSSKIIPDVNVPKTTIVVMGYAPERASNYNRIFDAYSQMDDVIDRVLFLWNNLDAPIPAVPENSEESRVEIVPLQQEKNSMNNRFGTDVIRHARTSSVLVVDDDIVLSRGMIWALIEGWVRSANDPLQRPVVGIYDDARMVGSGRYFFPCYRIDGWLFLQPHCWMMPLVGTSFGRSLAPSMENLRWRKNLVIGKTMLLSKQFLELYNNNKTITEYVEDHFCEDVLMNALVRKTTQGKDPVYVIEKSGHTRGGENNNGRLSIVRTKLNDAGGLSRRSLEVLLGAWLKQRVECVKFSEEHFGRDIW